MCVFIVYCPWQSLFHTGLHVFCGCIHLLFSGSKYIRTGKGRESLHNQSMNHVVTLFRNWICSGVMVLKGSMYYHFFESNIFSPFVDPPTKFFSKVPFSTHMHFGITQDFEPFTLFNGIMVYIKLKWNLAKKDPLTTTKIHG